MRLITGAALVVAVLLSATGTAFSQRRGVPAVSIEGTYENLTVGKGSGDLEGMRVILIDGGGSIHAIVQQAAGGAELPDPILSKVEVRGENISFSVQFPGQDHAQTLTGKVTAAGLTLRFKSPVPDELPMFLKRKKC